MLGDRRTPASARDLCRRIAVEYCPCEYLDVDDQRRYLDRFPDLWKHLRLDTVQRRNIGLLKAYEDGAQVLISVDEDSRMMNQDFAARHGIAGTVSELECVESTSGWFNVCSLLEEQNGTPFYHRGFPAGMRWKEDTAFTSISTAKAHVAVNAGFWLDDPDVDALTRMNRPIVVQGHRQSAPKTLALQCGTWSP